MNKTPRW